MKNRINHIVCSMLGMVVMSTGGAYAAQTDISNTPMETLMAVKPNVIFALDDSGSMDFEVLQQTNDGAIWWDGVSKSFTDSDGVFLFNESGSTGSAGGGLWHKYTYLFPNGTGSGKRQYGDSSFDHFAIPPTPEYAFLRSHEYNSLYYNPDVTYEKWKKAYVDGAMKVFADSDFTSALSHPIFGSHTLNLSQTVFSKSNNHTFRMHEGMLVPGAQMSGIERKKGSGGWAAVTTDVTIPLTETWSVAIPYFPATYYVKDNSCTSGIDCATAPDSQRLRRVEIKSGRSFPSGRTYAEEKQNFANWYTYHRKRKLMLSASMGVVLSKVNEIRGGLLRFNQRVPVTMYDFDNNNPSQNNLKLLGDIYQNPASGGTPTRDVLNYIGQQYMTNSNIIQKACQMNAAMVLTDGFSLTGGPTPPSYNAATWGSGAPYSTTFDKSLADIALSYYSVNLRPDLPAGLVPVDLNNTAANADVNVNLHMNTYGLTIGLKGHIFGTGGPEELDPFTNSPVWPNPNVTRSPAAIDDLWHASINGRGTMTRATDTTAATNSVRNMMYDLINKASSSSGVGLDNAYLDAGNNAVYASSHHIGYGDLRKYYVNLSNGTVTSGNLAWSAKALLDEVVPSDRVIVTYDGSNGIPFRLGNIPLLMRLQLGSLISGLLETSPIFTMQNTIDWIRGDQSSDNTVYRQRSYLLGSIVNAAPIVVSGVKKNYSLPGYHAFKNSMAGRSATVYQASNDGMLHAFDANSGVEKWAYIGKHSFEKLSLVSHVNYMHEYTLDSTPTYDDVYYDGQWHSLLVGGYGAGATGYYALDVTDPNAATETALAQKVLWEFPNDATPSNIRDDVGLTFGRPKIIKTRAAGWVVLVTSGYNNANGDGKGHLYVLDPKTGAVIKDIKTSAGLHHTPSGLAHISAYAENADYDPIVDYVYGADLEGNVWRFDFSGDGINKWKVKRMAQLKDSAGNNQAVTAEPELGKIADKRVVIVGTGKLLGQSDIAVTSTQTLYALIDNDESDPLISPLRSNLTSIGSADSTGLEGWYIDLQDAGERINHMPVLALNKLVVNVNKPSADGCTSSSYQYIVTLNSTTNPHDPPIADPIEAALAKISYTRTFMGNTLVSSPTLAVLPSDKVVAITHNADDTFAVTEVETQSNSSSNAVAWREVLRD